MRGILGYAAALAALAAPQIDHTALLPRGARPMRYQPGSLRKTTRHLTNGERECARRLRQIAAGSLRAENGLAL